jgi:uncharacterized protein (DUF1697 family)
MKTWIALLRGINVGGHKKVPMAELRSLCASLGFTSVTSYIQSGNVVFRSSAAATGVVAALEGAIAGRFGFEVRVVVRDLAQLRRVVAGNPFLSDGVVDASKLHVTFLADAPARSVAEAMRVHRIGADELRLVGREAYLHCPDGLGRTKLTPTFMERGFGTATTTRNWRTVNRLLEMASTL